MDTFVFVKSGAVAVGVATDITQDTVLVVELPVRVDGGVDV